MNRQSWRQLKRIAQDNSKPLDRLDKVICMLIFFISFVEVHGQRMKCFKLVKPETNLLGTTISIALM